MSDWEQWKAQVERELKGASYDKALVTTTREGLRVEPLYTERDFDARSDNALPGDAPWLRGARFPDGASGWLRCGRYASPRAINELREDLAAGMNAALVRVSEGASVEGLLSVVGARNAVLALEPDGVGALRAFDNHELTPRWWGLDPLGVLLRDGSIPEVCSEVIEYAGVLGARAMTVSVEAVESAGADAIQQLAWAIATGAQYVQWLTERGVTPERASGMVSFRVPVGRDVFMEISKLRALRVLWRAVLGAFKVERPSPMFVHAVGGLSTVAARDPWVNMLRGTDETFAAVLGGADMVTVRPFDALYGESPLGRRVAKNTLVILDEESHLGRVTDAVGGSYYVESLTRSLARAGWESFQEVHRKGGMAAAVMSGAIQDACEKSWRARREGLAKRREAVTGVSDFANVHERCLGVIEGTKGDARTSDKGETARPLEVHREAEVFEALRDRADAFATRPAVYLATLGARAEFTARAMWSQNLFAAGGFEVHEDAGSSDGGVGEVARRAVNSGAFAVCVCGSDALYETQGEALLAALREAGVRRVLWAGRPAERERALRDAGVSGFIYVGCDAESVLRELLDEVTA